MSSENELTFRLLSPSTAADKGRIRVRITLPHYGRAVAYVIALVDELKAKVPFAHEIVSGPDVQILGGPRVKNTMCVEMVISHQCETDAAAITALQAHRFSNFEEPLI